MTIRVQKLGRGSRAARRGRDSGLALVLALFAMFVISALAVAIITMSQTELLASTNFRAVTAADYAAEAGLQRTIEWLQNTYPTYGSSNTVTLFNNACYPVVATGSTCASAPITLSAMSGTAANYPDGVVQTAFSQALGNKTLTANNQQVNYSVAATLLRVRQAIDFPSGQLVTVRSWKVTSQGIAGGNQASVQSTATLQQGFALIPYALMASSTNCPGITLTGGFTDTWDSANGGYGAGNGFAANADVAANGQISSTSGQINGTSWVPATSPCAAGFAGSPAPTGGAKTVPQGLNIPDAPLPTPLPPIGAQDCPNATSPPGMASCSTTTLHPGNYGDLDIIQNVTLQGGPPGGTPAVYNMNSLDLIQGCIPPHGHGHGRTHTCLTGGSIVTINGPLIINLAGQSLAAGIDALSVGSTSQFINTGRASDLVILYNGTAPIDIEGGVQEVGVIYAPHAPLTVNGSLPWFGALVGNTLTVSGGAPIHYDYDLQNRLLQQTGVYHLLSYTRARF